MRYLVVVALFTVGCSGGPSSPSTIQPPATYNPAPIVSPPTYSARCVTVPGEGVKNPAVSCDIDVVPTR